MPPIIPRRSLRISIVLLAVIILLAAIILAACANTPIPEPATATPTQVPIPTITTTSTPDEGTTPAVVCAQTHGTIQQSTLTAKMLKYPLKVNVYLPPCYDPIKVLAYPVLYMLHGMTDTNQQWIDLGLTDTADQLISGKTIQPLIIVMPNEDSWQLLPEQSGYEDAIVTLLIPWVEEHYSACPERECRAIGGLSRGGNWAVKIGLDHWQLFAAVGAHSTPLFSGGISWLNQAVKDMPSVKDAPAMYVDVGNKDENLKQVTEFEKTLTELNVVHEFHQNTGYHEAAYWSVHMEEYLVWYASVLQN